MRKYWTIAKNSLQEYFAYRLNLGLEIVGGILFTLVTIWLWRAVVAGRPSIGGYSEAELVTYLIGTGLVASYYFIAAQGDEVNDDINRGFLSALLVKPMSPLANWFVRDQARKIMTFSVGVLGLLIVAFFYRSLLVPPASPGVFGIVLLFLFLGSMLHFFLFTLFALVAFWGEQTWGERFLLRTVNELAAGVIIPLTFFPIALQSIFNVLPFRFFAFVPMEIYLGKIAGLDILRELALLFVWIVAVAIAVWVVMRRGLRQYAGEGI